MIIKSSDLKFSIKMFILSFELQYSKSLFYIMEKYLNHIYFMKILVFVFGKEYLE